MKTEEIYFVVRLEVKTEHAHIDQTLQEMEKTARFFITNTPKVKVLNCEILTTKVRNIKSRDHYP